MERAAGPGFAPDTPVALAVSGGGDSLAMLWLGAQAFGKRAAVVSVDHGLRPDARQECATVEALAAGLGLHHTTLTLAQRPGPGNIQAEARDARYAAMAGWCRDQGIGYLLTAHHADDQAETLLLRLARGSGLSGLAGIRRAQRLHGIAVLRPLLGWRRADLAGALAPSGWPVADDPSNRDPRFDRTQARTLLARELLEREPLLQPERLAAAAGHLAEAEEALGWAADRAWASRAATADGGLAIDPEGLPAELQRRLLLRGLLELGATAPSGPDIARLLARLGDGKPGTLGGVKARALGDGRWRMCAAPPRRVGR